MLQEVRSHPRPSTTCNGVREHKALQTVTVISLSIKDVEYLLMETPGLRAEEGLVLHQITLAYLSGHNIICWPIAFALVIF